MLTIGRKHTGPRRDMQEDCAYCGDRFLLSQLRLNADDLWVCPEDFEGRVAREIDAQRAIDASEPTVIRGKDQRR